jgi:hypothetical protein
VKEMIDDCWTSEDSQQREPGINYRLPNYYGNNK